ncbi:hypothetical protein E2C01_102406 [Portunus trituberculatus]|uniref:Uncharacterized protein n=1 Tax=Portunus trituberculatus TaxID=210409 RepID=A0A5B7KMI5_PORTR|nr:hypothetical protein [Portunus trituberculatus]
MAAWTQQRPRQAHINGANTSPSPLMAPLIVSAPPSLPHPSNTRDRPRPQPSLPLPSPAPKALQALVDT